MPNDISLTLFLVWIAVGFAVGLGWSLAGWVVGKLLR
jgi:hypothetical protein